MENSLADIVRTNEAIFDTFLEFLRDTVTYRTFSRHSGYLQPKLIFQDGRLVQINIDENGTWRPENIRNLRALKWRDRIDSNGSRV